MITISVSPNPLVAGGTAHVSVSGATPNSSVTVTVNNGGEITENIIMTTDANGNGSADWEVPGDWIQASFNTEGAEEVSRQIVQSD